MRFFIRAATGIGLVLAIHWGCGTSNRYPSLEFGHGVSLAWPHLEVVGAERDTIRTPWVRAKADEWHASARSGSWTVEGRLLMKPQNGRDRRWLLHFELDTDGSERLTRWMPLVVSQSSGGFFDFSTGEPPYFAAGKKGKTKPFRLAPDSSTALRADTLFAFQPVSQVLCIFLLHGPPGGEPYVAIHRQAGRANKRRYDLALGWTYPPDPRPGTNKLRASVEVVVITGKAAERLWRGYHDARGRG